MTARRRYLFVSGCARSGTTVLTTALNWSDDVLVFQERYAPLLRYRPQTFLPDLFEPKRLLDFREDECGYASFESKHSYHSRVANPKDFARSDKYRFIGDKITHLYRRFGIFNEIGWSEQDITLLHVIRNPIEVAISYDKRHAQPTDGWRWSAEDAIVDWSDSTLNACEFLGNPGKVRFGLVDYDDMFGKDFAWMSEHVRGIFRFVGIEYGEKQHAGMSRIFSSFESIRSGRAEDSVIRDKVQAAISPDLVRKHLELRNRSIGRGPLQAPSRASR